MYKIITLLILCHCCITGFAQKKKSADTVRKYLDSRLALTNKANGVYAAVAMKQGDHWLLVSAYADTTPLLRAYFQDEALTIKDGPFILYHPRKIKMFAGSYVNNIKQGVWMAWHKNGQLKDSGTYRNNHMIGEWRAWNDSGQITTILHFPADSLITTVMRGTVDPRDKRPSIMAGDTAIGVLYGPAMSFYTSGQMRDSGAYRSDRKEGTWKQWYPDGQLESVGTFVKNIQEGTWEYYRENGTRSSREKYVKNKIAALECFDEQGNPAGNTCPVLKPPVAQGKFLDFDKYALDNMFWPEPLKRSDVQGEVEIEYTISKEGELKNLRVIRTPHHLMSAEVVRFFKTLKWSPAVSHNRPIDYAMKYKVPFYR